MLVALATLSCGSEFRRAKTGGHPQDNAAPIIVDFPPPPARVEVVPADPGPPCVWVDGQWNYVARRWRWRDGDWVQPAEGCYYAPPRMVWVPQMKTDTLYYLEGRWYRDSGVTCDLPRSCTPPDAGTR